MGGDIYKRRCSERAIETDAPVQHYYERLAGIQQSGRQVLHQHLRDIFDEITNTYIPNSVLKDWAVSTFPHATDYWSFRKTMTSQMALLGLLEFCLHLTRMKPDMLHVAQDSGLLNVSYFKFDLHEVTGDLEASRPTPFRLTPNFSSFFDIRWNIWSP